MPITVRLSPKTERTLNALAKRRRQTKSDVVRAAIEQFGAESEPRRRRVERLRAWADIIGIGRFSARDPNKTTGEQFTEIVREKARARRAR